MINYLDHCHDFKAVEQLLSDDDNYSGSWYPIFESHIPNNSEQQDQGRDVVPHQPLDFNTKGGLFNRIRVWSSFTFDPKEKEKVKSQSWFRKFVDDALSVGFWLFGKVLEGRREASCLLDLMEGAGIEPNESVILQSMVDTPCHCGPSTDIPCIVFAQMLESNYKHKALSLLVSIFSSKSLHCWVFYDVFVYSSLFNVYAKYERMEKALEVFEGMSKRDLVLRSTTFLRLVSIGKALLYQIWVEAPPSSNSQSLFRFLNSSVNAARRVLDEMPKRGIKVACDNLYVVAAIGAGEMCTSGERVCYSWSNSSLVLLSIWALDTFGAGDQGHVFGYTTIGILESMPLGHILAPKLGARLTEVCKINTCVWLRPMARPKPLLSTTATRVPCFQFMPTPPATCLIQDRGEPSTSTTPGKPSLLASSARSTRIHNDGCKLFMELALRVRIMVGSPCHCGSSTGSLGSDQARQRRACDPAAVAIHNFLWFYLKAAMADAEVESLSRYLAVLTLQVCDEISDGLQIVGSPHNYYMVGNPHY